MSLFGTHDFPFIPPPKLNQRDMLLHHGYQVGVYRWGDDSSGWDLETVYTLQDGAYRIIITPQVALPGHDPNDHADPQVDG